MANIIYTNKCNLSCPFCFANDNNTKDTKDKTQNYSSTDLWKTVNFLNENPIRLCGGEPTQHPDLIEHVDILIKSGKSIFMMTNGIWPKNFINYINCLSPANQLQFSFLFNILPPNLYSENQLNTIKKSLDACCPTRTTLGITIYKEDFEYEYIIELAKKYEIKRIRWSVSNTTLERVDLKAYFQKLAHRIELFLSALEENGLTTIHDCGYVPLCFYSKDQLHKLNFMTDNSMKSGCSHSPIDIDNNGNTWRCFGLYNWIKVPANKFNSLSEVQKYYDRRIKVLNNLYLFEECKDCMYHNKSCGGGCHALRINNALKKNENICLNPMDDDDEILKTIPKKAKNVIIKQATGNKIVFTSSKVYANLDFNTIVFLETIDGYKSVSDLINLWKDNFSSYENAKSTVINACRKTFEMDLVRINYNYNQKWTP